MGSCCSIDSNYPNNNIVKVGYSKRSDCPENSNPKKYQFDEYNSKFKENKRFFEKQEARFDMNENYMNIPNIFNEDPNMSFLSKEETYGAVGLFNLGETCFINSAIQILSNTQPLADYFLNNLHLKELNENNYFKTEGNVALKLGALFRNIWINCEETINPEEFFETLKLYAPRFTEGKQEDVQEFLAFLLDIIHEELNRARKYDEIAVEEISAMSASKNIIDKVKNEIERESAEEWKKYLKQNRSIIVDLFQGQIKSSLTCLVCNHVSNKFEPIMYLSLPLPETEDSKRFDFNLIDCLNEFTKEENLGESSLWECPECKKKSATKKRIELWKMPNILVIHLKRFNFSNGEGTKLETFIHFPLKGLDFSKFLALPQKEPPVYDLYAVANHQGTMKMGHYTVFARNDENKKWFEFDDAFVQMLGKPEKKIISKHAYLLFYAKSSVDYFQRQTLKAPLQWPYIYENLSNLTNSRSLNLRTLRESSRKGRETMIEFGFNNGERKVQNIKWKRKSLAIPADNDDGTDKRNMQRSSPNRGNLFSSHECLHDNFLEFNERKEKKVHAHENLILPEIEYNPTIELKSDEETHLTYNTNAGAQRKSLETQLNYPNIDSDGIKE